MARVKVTKVTGVKTHLDRKPKEPNLLPWAFIIPAIVWGVWLLAALFTHACRADEPITGWVEGRRYVRTNMPAFVDQTGDPLKYGVDFQLNFPTFIPHFSIMAGADAATGNTSFSQIAGRFGTYVNINRLEVGLYHRSNHSIDHSNDFQWHFLNQNAITVKYNFSIK